MNISDKEREIILSHIRGHKVYNTKAKNLFEMLSKSVDSMSNEEAYEILRVSKIYPENKDIDENKITDVMKVMIRYINRFFGVFGEFKYPDDSVDRSFKFFDDKVNYYNALVEELNSKEFNFTKIRVLLALEKIFSDYQELSKCQGLVDINGYIRNNINQMVIKQVRIAANEDMKQREYFLRGLDKKKTRKRG